MVPPDPIPNSEVKRRNADGSVGLPHVRVGHRQVDTKRTPVRRPGFFIGEKSHKRITKPLQCGAQTDVQSCGLPNIEVTPITTVKMLE